MPMCVPSCMHIPDHSSPLRYHVHAHVSEPACSHEFPNRSYHIMKKHILIIDETEHLSWKKIKKNIKSATLTTRAVSPKQQVWGDYIWFVIFFFCDTVFFFFYTHLLLPVPVNTFLILIHRPSKLAEKLTLQGLSISWVLLCHQCLL